MATPKNPSEAKVVDRSSPDELGAPSIPPLQPIESSLAPPTPEEMVGEIRRVAADLLKESDRLRVIQDASQLRQGLMELNQSANQLRAVAAASTAGLQSAFVGFTSAPMVGVPGLTTVTPIQAAPASPAPVPSGCGCDDRNSSACGCVSPNCCCFEIVLSRIRVTSIGGIAGLAGEGGVTLELQFYSSIDGIGTVLPNLNSFISVRGKLGGPGSWVEANKVIREVCIGKGSPKSVTIHTEVKEHDKIFKDDIGSSTKRIDLDCCCSLDRVETDEVEMRQGEGSAVVGVEYKIRRVC